MSKVAKNTLIYTIGTILPKAASFVLLPIYTKFLSPAEYGILSSMWALEGIATIFFSLSLGTSVFRLYWDYEDEELRKKFLGTIYVAIGISSLVWLALIFIFQNLIDGIYNSISFFPYFAFSMVTICITGFFDIPQKLLMIREKAMTYVTLSILFFLLNSGLILYFVVWLKQGASGYLLATLIATAVFFPVYLIIGKQNISFNFHFPYFKAALLFALPGIPTLLSSWVLDLSDRIFIERYFSLTEVGIYSLSYKIAGIALILSSSFNLAYRPVFFRLANSEEQETTRKNIYDFNNLFLVLLLFFFFALSFFSKEIIVLFFDSSYSSAYLYIPVIALAYFLSVMGGLIARYFEQSKKMKQNMYIYIFSSLVNVAFNFLLIPSLGAFGAAYSTLLAMLFTVVAGYFYTKKHCYFVEFNWKTLAVVFSVLTLLFILFEFVLVFPLYYALGAKTLLTLVLLTFLIVKYLPDIKSAYRKM
ncbi:MAG: oligosaccharide flippase family protein [Bacteroidetes bacterium]|nr:oligosaccharide flippase family protein [Bacteroidota bacterium]